ncbi:hypothetical protein E2I00_008409, partial [Balaenoptera physalus]
GQAVPCGTPTAAQVHVAFRQRGLAASALFGSVISVFKISFKRQGESWARSVNMNPEVCRGQGQNEVTRTKLNHRHVNALLLTSTPERILWENMCLSPPALTPPCRALSQAFSSCITSIPIGTKPRRQGGQREYPKVAVKSATPPTALPKGLLGTDRDSEDGGDRPERHRPRLRRAASWPGLGTLPTASCSWTVTAVGSEWSLRRRPRPTRDARFVWVVHAQAEPKRENSYKFSTAEWQGPRLGVGSLLGCEPRAVKDGLPRQTTAKGMARCTWLARALRVQLARNCLWQAYEEKAGQTISKILSNPWVRPLQQERTMASDLMTDFYHHRIRIELQKEKLQNNGPHLELSEPKHLYLCVHSLNPCTLVLRHVQLSPRGPGDPHACATSQMRNREITKPLPTCDELFFLTKSFPPTRASLESWVLSREESTWNSENISENVKRHLSSAQKPLLSVAQLLFALMVQIWLGVLGQALLLDGGPPLVRAHPRPRLSGKPLVQPDCILWLLGTLPPHGSDLHHIVLCEAEPTLSGILCSRYDLTATPIPYPAAGGRSALSSDKCSYSFRSQKYAWGIRIVLQCQPKHPLLQAALRDCSQSSPRDVLSSKLGRLQLNPEPRVLQNHIYDQERLAGKGKIIYFAYKHRIYHVGSGLSAMGQVLRGLRAQSPALTAPGPGALPGHLMKRVLGMEESDGAERSVSLFGVCWESRLEPVCELHMHEGEALTGDVKPRPSLKNKLPCWPKSALPITEATSPAAALLVALASVVEQKSSGTCVQPPYGPASMRLKVVFTQHGLDQDPAFTLTVHIPDDDQRATVYAWGLTSIPHLFHLCEEFSARYSQLPKRRGSSSVCIKDVQLFKNKVVENVKMRAAAEPYAISFPPWDPSVYDEAGGKRLGQTKKADEPRVKPDSVQPFSEEEKTAVSEEMANVIPKIPKTLQLKGRVPRRLDSHRDHGSFYQEFCCQLKFFPEACREPSGARVTKLTSKTTSTMATPCISIDQFPFDMFKDNTLHLGVQKDKQRGPSSE